jgi:hypothetical protein
MKFKVEITEKEKHFLYALLKAVLLRALIAGVAIGLGYLIAWMGWIDKVNFPYVAGVMFVTMFDFGRDYQKHCL